MLDQNFPWHVTGLPWPHGIAIERLEEFNATLTSDVEDWEILLALHRHGGITGFITNDARILDSPREMLVLSRTSLTLVATAGVGHDPLRATALVMLHLDSIVQANLEGPYTYRLRPNSKDALTAGQRINRIAQHQSRLPNEVMRQEVANIKALLSRDDARLLRL